MTRRRARTGRVLLLWAAATATVAGLAGWLGSRHVEDDVRVRAQAAVKAVVGADGHQGKDVLLAVVDGRDVVLVGQAGETEAGRAQAAVAAVEGVREVRSAVSVVAAATTTTTLPPTTTTTSPVRRVRPRLVRAPLPDGLVRVRLSPGQVVLEGTLPDDVSRERLLNGLVDLDRWIVDGTAVGPGGASVRTDLLARFARAVEIAYPRLQTGTLVLSGDHRVVRGRTREPGQRADLVARLRSATGRWTVIDAVLDGPTPAASAGGDAPAEEPAPTTTVRADFVQEERRDLVQRRLDELLADNPPLVDEAGVLAPVTGLLLEEAVGLIIEAEPSAVRVLVTADAAQFAGDFQARQWSQRRAELLAQALRARGLLDARVVPIGLGLDATTPRSTTRIVLTYPQATAPSTTTTAPADGPDSPEPPATETTGA